MSVKLPDPGALAFFSFMQNYSYPDGVGNGLSRGPAVRMINNIVSRLDAFLNQDGPCVRVALDMDGKIIEGLIVLDTDSGKTHVVPVSITPQLASLGDQSVFLNDFRSAGLVTDAIMRIVRSAVGETPIT